MKEYLFETHAHTKEVSTCAVCTCEDLVKHYVGSEYDGVILTNHMNVWTFRRVGLEDAEWQVKVDHFMAGFNKLKAMVPTDFTLLLGMEICFYNTVNDYLVYGVTEDFLRSHGDLMAMNFADFYQLAKENGMLVIQAHPLRRRMTIENWNNLDGYEVYNGNPRHWSNNEIAENFAALHGKKIMTSGSDFHEEEDAGIGGMYFSNPIRTNEDLLRELKAGNYRLKKTPFEHTRPE